MKKRIISLMLVVVMAVIALVGCGFSYNDDMSDYANVKFDKASTFKNISIAYGDFNHTDAAKRAKLVLDALNTALAKKADTETKYTENTADVSFDKSRDIIYYCYYAVVSEGQEGAGKVVYTNYMSADKAISLQLGLEVKEDTLNAAIYKIINDGHYTFDKGTYKTETEGKVEAGDTIYISYTKSYDTTVEGQAGTVTETAVYHKLDASATGADKLFFDQLVEKERGFTNYKGDEYKITVESEGVTYNYTNYTIHFASEGNLEAYTALGVKFGSTAETTVDYYTGAASENAKVKLNADTKLDYYIFPTHYVKTPEINATNILNLVYGANITYSTMAKVVFGEEYFTAIEAEDPAAELDKLYEKYKFTTDSGELPFDEFITHLDTLQGDLDTAKKDYDSQKTKFESAKKKLETARSEEYLALEKQVADAKAAIDAAADETAKAAAQKAYDDLVAKTENKKLLDAYSDALSSYYTEREVFIGEAKPTASTPGSEVAFDAEGKVVLAENYESTATEDSKCGKYNKALAARDKAVADLITKVGETTIVNGYKFYDKYKSLENSYNQAFKKSVATAVFELVYKNVEVTEAPEELVDEIYEQLIDNLQYYYYYNIDVKTGNYMFSGEYTQEDYEAKAYYHVYDGSFERFMTEYAVAALLGVQAPADYDEALQYVKAEATSLAKERVLVFAAAEALGVKIDDDDLDAYLEELGYTEVLDEEKENLRIGYQFSVLIDELIKGYEVKGEADANGYYATYFDYTKCEDGSANPYISAITNKDVAVTE